MVQPGKKAYGIHKGTNGSMLEYAELCDTCAKPEMKVRKFLNLKSAWDSKLADVTTEEFKLFKLETEEIIDKIFEDALLAEHIPVPGRAKNFDHSTGYYGATVLSAYETGEGRGAGRRRRAIVMEGKTGVEIEVAMKLDSIPLATLDTIFSSQVYPSPPTLHSSSAFSKSTCKVSDLAYDTTKLDFTEGVQSTDKVAVGMKLFLECKDQLVMNRNSTYDPEDDGFDVICGNGGAWQGPVGINLAANFSGCTPMPMCSAPPVAHPDQSTMVRLAYIPVNKKGSFPVGESVFYGCDETKDELLDDDSGMGVYELKCTQKDDKDPAFTSSAQWPKCVAKKRCRDVPNPDSAAKLTGMELDPTTKAILLPGEFAIYNCTDSDNPVTETGSFFSVECISGSLITPTTGNWPQCRGPTACNSSLAALPVPPDDTYLIVQLAPDTVVMELDTITYNCSANPNKTYIVEEETNTMEVTCLPGAVWPEEVSWQKCEDSTTTTPRPTTSTPSRRKACYCLGDRKKVDSDTWTMNMERHMAILDICRTATITFPKPKILPDINNNKYIVPIKEQCGVTNPYVREFGQVMEDPELAQREFLPEDTCACSDDKVVGYWITLSVPSLKWKDNLLKLESKTSRLMIDHIEKLFDTLHLESIQWEEQTTSPESRYVRTRVMRFKKLLEPLLNQVEYEADPDNVVPEYTVMVTMEVQYAQETLEDGTKSEVLTLQQFKDKTYELFAANSTLSLDPLPLGTGITLDLNCTSCIPDNICPCQVEQPYECLNDDFTGIPPQLTHQFVQLWPNATKKAFPYNITEVDGSWPNGSLKITVREFSLVVGETVDLKCDDPLGVKIFQTEDPELMDNILTIVCKPDKYYNVPSKWPDCKAQCAEDKPRPANGTRMILDVEHREMRDGAWNEKFWEDQKVYYKCEDERNEGVVTQPHLIGPNGTQVGDKRKTTLEFKCTGDSSYNTPLEFPNCAPKPDVCECLGDMTPAQSQVVLDMACYEDQFLKGNYHYANHTDVDNVGLVLIANKTRCGVKKADYPTLKDKCYCHERDKVGVANGFWHKMEVLSLPWHEDLFWPNTSMFQEEKLKLEKELDKMYLNSTEITAKRYVRSVVIKFIKGSYKMENLVSTTSTTTTTTTTSTTTTKPARGRRGVNLAELMDDQRDYELDPVSSWRDDDKFFIGARGYIQNDHANDPLLHSTEAWVEHQFQEEYTVEEFDFEDFEYAHMDLLDERNGQWMDENGNTSLWLSQGCYFSGKCLVTDLLRCENVVLNNLPFGFTHEKPKRKVLVQKNSDLTEEYKLPVGGEVNIVCKDAWQKITVDQWDVDPHDMKMTVKCLPTFKYDLPSENFPKCRSYCPAPARLWNETAMSNLDAGYLPLQLEFSQNPAIAVPSATDPRVGYKQLEPNDFTGLTLDVDTSHPDTELWEGERVFFICKNNSLGVEKGLLPRVAFKCRADGIYAVPDNMTWPECYVKTTTAKPPIVDAVLKSRMRADSDLEYSIHFAEQIKAKNQGDEDFYWIITVPCAILLLLLVICCLFFSRADSICCQVCNRDYEIKEMQNYGHGEFKYS